MVKGGGGGQVITAGLAVFWHLISTLSNRFFLGIVSNSSNWELKFPQMISSRNDYELWDFASTSSYNVGRGQPHDVITGHKENE